MKKLFQLILILSILISTSAFRWYQKPHISLSSSDIIPIEDASNNYDTSHITFNDIVIYLEDIYQLRSLILESIAAGIIDVDLDNTAYPWAVDEGGTGTATFIDGGILLGSGTGAITALGVASNGQIPIGDGTTDPVLATITGTANETTVTNGAGSITLGLADGINATKVANSTVSNIEYQYINSLSENAQDQLDTKLTLAAASELTIATGVITKTQTVHTIDTESDAAADDVDTINGGSAGDILIVQAQHTDRTVTLKDGTGNLDLWCGDLEFDEINKYLILVYDGTASNWIIAGGAAIKVVSDATYGAGWNGTNKIAPSKNVVYDKIETLCLKSVLGTSIGTSLLLDGAVLKASAILQKYHGVDPSVAVLAMLGGADDAAILNSIGDGIVTLADTTLADEDYLWFWDYDDNGTTKRVDANELRNVAASTTLAGEIAIATINEINAGTNATIAVTPDALAGSMFGQKDIGWTICDSDTNTTIANGKKGYAVPQSMSSSELMSCTCSVADLNGATGGTTTVMMRRVRAGVSADMFSVAVTLSHGQYEAHDATIDVNNDDLNRGDLLYFDVDAVTSGHPQKGLSCTALVCVP